MGRHSVFVSVIVHMYSCYSTSYRSFISMFDSTFRINICCNANVQWTVSWQPTGNDRRRFHRVSTVLLYVDGMSRDISNSCASIFNFKAVGNAETLVLEKGFQTKLFPEGIHSISMLAESEVLWTQWALCVSQTTLYSDWLHVTGNGHICCSPQSVCHDLVSLSLHMCCTSPSDIMPCSLIFSLVDLYYINRISQTTYAGTTTTTAKQQVKYTTGKQKSK